MDDLLVLWLFACLGTMERCFSVILGAKGILAPGKRVATDSYVTCTNGTLTFICDAQIPSCLYLSQAAPIMHVGCVGDAAMGDRHPVMASLIM